MAEVLKAATQPQGASLGSSRPSAAIFHQCRIHSVWFRLARVKPLSEDRTTRTAEYALGFPRNYSCQENSTQTESPSRRRRCREMPRTTRKQTKSRRNLPQNCNNNSNAHYINKLQVVDSYACYGDTSSAERAKNFRAMKFSAIDRTTTP